MNNLTNSAKKLDKVFEIVHIVFGALAIASIVLVALIALSWIMGWNPEFIATDYNKLELGFLELTVADGYAPNKWQVLGQTAFVLLVACRLFYDGRRGVGYIREILKPMTEEKPFDSIVSTNLKKLANYTCALGIGLNLQKIIGHILLLKAYDLPLLLLSEKVSHVEFMFVFDLSFLVVYGILLLLSYIFRYGEELQQLSDETL